jgi:hypothetical protein
VSLKNTGTWHRNWINLTQVVTYDILKNPYLPACVIFLLYGTNITAHGGEHGTQDYNILLFM